ncbi:AP2 domain-containing protein [Listeria monocytogenes]
MYQKASEKMKETMKANIALVESIRISSISNKKLQSDNKSGHTVVTFKDNKWVARICVSGVEHQLGSFVTKEETIDARIEGEKYFQPLINKYNNRLDVFYSERRPFWT